MLKFTNHKKDNIFHQNIMVYEVYMHINQCYTVKICSEVVFHISTYMYSFMYVDKKQYSDKSTKL